MPDERECDEEMGPRRATPLNAAGEPGVPGALGAPKLRHLHRHDVVRRPGAEVKAPAR